MIFVPVAPDLTINLEQIVELRDRGNRVQVLFANGSTLYVNKRDIPPSLNLWPLPPVPPEKSGDGTAPSSPSPTLWQRIASVFTP